VYLQQPEFLHFSVSSGLLLAISAKDLEQESFKSCTATSQNEKEFVRKNIFTQASSSS